MEKTEAIKVIDEQVAVWTRELSALHKELRMLKDKEASMREPIQVLERAISCAKNTAKFMKEY